MALKLVLIVIQFDFPAPLGAPLARVSLAPSHSYQNKISKKRRSLGSPRFKPITIQSQSNYTTNSTKSCFMITNMIQFFYNISQHD